MSTHNENPTGKKSIYNLKEEAVNGEVIMGGGKGDLIMPTPEEEAAGINNSGFPTTADDGTVATNDDGTIQVIDDGTIKVF